MFRLGMGGAWKAGRGPGLGPGRLPAVGMHGGRHMRTQPTTICERRVLFVLSWEHSVPRQEGGGGAGRGGAR